MANYLILIYGDEQVWAAADAQEQRRTDEGHVAFVGKAGTAVLGGHQLQPSSTATSLRPGADRAMVTDGPFLETKEGLGGYYVIKADDLDQAIELVAMLPEVTGGSGGVEIRPVVEHG